MSAMLTGAAPAAFLTSVLIGIDITLAGLFWAMGGESDVLGKLLRKILYVGAFALILNNFARLAEIVFRSFTQAGIKAGGGTLTPDQLLKPGQLAGTGFSAAWPLLDQASDMAGFTTFFDNFLTIMVLLIAWLIVICAFFVLAVQVFITILEFKLTTLAGFILVPFALWNRTSFLAERVLGSVVSSGIKVMVLAVIIGIGSGFFIDFTEALAGAEPDIGHPRHQGKGRRMKFRRSMQRYGRTPEPETPYQRAGQLWDERIGSARVQAHSWRMMAFGGLALSSALAGGLVWQSMQSRVVPYVVSVDTLGQAVAVAPADARYTPSDPQIAWFLARFILDTSSGSGETRRTHILLKPYSAGLATNLVITTDRRSYHLELASTPRTAMAAISWTYPADALIALKRDAVAAEAARPVATGVPLEALQFGYRISGDTPAWRPLRAFDDGRQSFIEFPASIAQGEAPPLFVIGTDGTAELVNYRVAGRFYVVDRLFGAAELRLGGKKQQIVRITREESRRARGGRHD